MVSSRSGSLGLILIILRDHNILELSSSNGLDRSVKPCFMRQRCKFSKYDHTRLWISKGIKIIKTSSEEEDQATISKKPILKIGRMKRGTLDFSYPLVRTLTTENRRCKPREKRIQLLLTFGQGFGY